VSRLGFKVVRDSRMNVQASFGERPTPLVRYIRGGKCQTVGTAMDQFSAALQFPWYFGNNLDALSECLRDLSWLWPFSRITIVIFDANLFLVDEDDAARARNLIELLSDTVRYWATDEGDAGRTSPTPIGMEILLQVAEEDWSEDCLSHLAF